jgi:hypothetical protein
MGFYEIMKTVFTYFGRFRIINDRIDNEPYLERYYIFLKDRTTFPFNIFIHKFLKSDPDDLHNHPWAYFTFILRGGYWEYTKDSKVWYPPFTYRYAPANTFHRIELDSTKPPCWTLFIPGYKVQDWGFNTPEGWIQHEEYLQKKKCL